MAAVPPQPAAEGSEISSRPFLISTIYSRQIALAVLAFFVALALLGQGISSAFIKDAEPQSAQWIVDIVKNGNWLLQRDYYQVVNPKPPLFYWLSAIVTETPGNHVDENSARVVSLVAGA
ncbi:MAG TPA: hypothetical protein VJ728_01705, partial [Candidatus Binataceae bacterium]|nr:hypothetical protein [Candidatus Binataceae bacterium]